MNECDLENVLDQVAKDLASATGTIREEVVLHGDLLAPDPSPSERAATPFATILNGSAVEHDDVVVFDVRAS